MTLALDAAPKIGGVLPVIAKSILPAVAASICGGPEVKVENAILYGSPSSAPGGAQQRFGAALLVADLQGHVRPTPTAVRSPGASWAPELSSPRHAAGQQPDQDRQNGDASANDRLIRMRIPFSSRLASESHAELVEQLGAVALGVRPTSPRRRRASSIVSVWIDPAVVEHQHPVGERDGLVDVVGHQQHAESVFAPQVEQQARASSAGSARPARRTVRRAAAVPVRRPARGPAKPVAPDHRTASSGHASARSARPTSASARSARACASASAEPGCGSGRSRRSCARRATGTAGAPGTPAPARRRPRARRCGRSTGRRTPAARSICRSRCARSARRSRRARSRTETSVEHVVARRTTC